MVAVAINATTEEKQALFYQWKLRHYFTMVEEGDKNMRVQCKLCAPSSKTLSSARNTTSNLKSHQVKLGSVSWTV